LPPTDVSCSLIDTSKANEAALFFAVLINLPVLRRSPYHGEFRRGGARQEGCVSDRAHDSWSSWIGLKVGQSHRRTKLLKLRTRRVPRGTDRCRRPRRVQGGAQCFSRLCELVESAGQAAAAGEPFAYAELARTVVLGAQAVQCDLHAVVISEMAFEDSRLLIDGVLHRRTVQATTTLYSLAGPVPVTR
jgi:hypothetical protein